jgi:lipoprotein-releasing system ATP-binding protein
MIEIQNITKSFGSLQVLKGITLTIGSGEVVSIVGPSGAGKTTLLQIIGTLDRPDSGTVHFNIVTHDEQLAQLTDRTIHLKDGMVEG